MKNILFTLIALTFILSAKAQTTPISPSDTVYTTKTSLDQLPQFPGGTDKLIKFLSKNLKWSSKTTEVPGRVIISFIVEKDGSLSNFKVIKKGGSEIDMEALRVMKLSPKWIPRIKNGKKVRSKYSLPISIDLSGE